MKTTAPILLLLILGSALNCASPSVLGPNLEANASQHFALKQEESSCQSDEDCIFFAADCCDCRQGGKQTAVNKKYQSQLQSRFQNTCSTTACIQMISQDPSCQAYAPVCRNNFCTVPE